MLRICRSCRLFAFANRSASSAQSHFISLIECFFFDLLEGSQHFACYSKVGDLLARVPICEAQPLWEGRVWFGCHPLRADFIKRRLTGAHRRLPAALWVESVSQSPLTAHVVSTRQMPSVIAASSSPTPTATA
jgi:hypothetical protein